MLRLGLLRFASLWIFCLAVLATSFCRQGLAAGFDHDGTRFPLQGFHRLVECETCHVNGRFKGTPVDCFACHGSSGVVPGGGKSPHHIPSTNDCSECHNQFSWDTVNRVEHSQVQGQCAQCHNGVMAAGKPATHVATTATCDSCHTSATWSVARFDHSGISDNCTQCHNGVNATGKHPGHITTAQECDTCHATRAWLPANFNHSGITGTCSSCHNGSSATGKPADHLTTNAQCDVCHSTNAWEPATFSHDNVTGSCASCHNGSTATGKNNQHFITQRDCNQCHTTHGWAPLQFSHQSGNYPSGHRQSLDCADCHIGNNEATSWRFPAYQPDCAACHANNYESDEHRKTDQGNLHYSVSELRDCTGACHVYTNSSLTTISDFRTGHHRISDSGFGD